MWKHRDSWAIFLIGFAFAIPIALASNLLIVRMHESGVSLANIGILGVVGLVYLFKPGLITVMKLVRPPLWHCLGLYRAHCFWSILMCSLSTIVLGKQNPAEQVVLLYVLAGAITFFGLMVDVSLHAHRLHISTSDSRGALVSASQTGLRSSFLLATASGIFVSQWTWLPMDAWEFIYDVLSLATLAGILGVLLISRGSALECETRRRSWRETFAEDIRGLRGIIDAVPGGFLHLAVLIGFYRASTMTSEFLAMPMYLDSAFTKNDIVFASVLYSGVVKIIAAATSGLLLKRWSMRDLLFFLTVLQVLAALSYILVYRCPVYWMLMLEETVTCWISGLSIVVFFWFLTVVAGMRHAAMIFVLLSSLAIVVPKILMVVGGHLAHLMGYECFYAYCALVGLPAVWAARGLRTRLESREIRLC